MTMVWVWAHEPIRLADQSEVCTVGKVEDHPAERDDQGFFSEGQKKNLSVLLILS